jgi:hypothetical protein
LQAVAPLLEVFELLTSSSIANLWWSAASKLPLEFNHIRLQAWPFSLKRKLLPVLHSDEAFVEQFDRRTAGAHLWPRQCNNPPKFFQCIWMAYSTLKFDFWENKGHSVLLKVYLQMFQWESFLSEVSSIVLAHFDRSLLGVRPEMEGITRSGSVLGYCLVTKGLTRSGCVLGYCLVWSLRLAMPSTSGLTLHFRPHPTLNHLPTLKLTAFWNWSAGDGMKGPVIGPSFPTEGPCLFRTYWMA